MNTKRSRKKTAEPSTTSMNLITHEVAQRLSAIHLMEAEIKLLTAKLNNMTAFKQQLEYLGEEPKGYLQQLMERRTELLQRLRAERASTMHALRPVDRNRLNILTWQPSFWNVQSMPVMTEFINQPPGVSGTSGEIVTEWLGPGGVSFGGWLQDDGSQNPLKEKWWIHTWACTTVFPPAPELTRLNYSFSVQNDTFLIDNAVISGSLWAFITVGTTSDVSQPMNWGGGSLWPVNDVRLP